MFSIILVWKMTPSWELGQTQWRKREIWNNALKGNKLQDPLKKMIWKIGVDIHFRPWANVWHQSKRAEGLLFCVREWPDYTSKGALTNKTMTDKTFNLFPHIWHSRSRVAWEIKKEIHYCIWQLGNSTETFSKPVKELYEFKFILDRSSKPHISYLRNRW